MRGDVQHAIDTVLATLPGPADERRGYMDVKVLDRQGKEHLVRVTKLPAGLSRPAASRFAVTENWIDFLMPYLPRQYASAAFLESLTPPSLAELFNVTATLAFGSAGLREQIAARLRGECHQMSPESTNHSGN